MTATWIDLDDDTLHRVMALAGVPDKAEAVNLALRYYAEQHEPITRVARHFERARHWGAVADADRLHRAEKSARG
jgi:Arc/MetJ family transcription regulator